MRAKATWQDVPLGQSVDIFYERAQPAEQIITQHGKDSVMRDNGCLTIIGGKDEIRNILQRNAQVTLRAPQGRSLQIVTRKERRGLGKSSFYIVQIKDGRNLGLRDPRRLRQGPEQHFETVDTGSGPRQRPPMAPRVFPRPTGHPIVTFQYVLGYLNG